MNKTKKGDISIDKMIKLIVVLLLLIVLILIVFPLIKKAIAPIFKITI